MTRTVSQRLLLHVGSLGAFAVAALVVAAGIGWLAGPHALLPVTSISSSVERAVAADDALAGDLAPWRAPDALVRVNADRLEMIERLSAGDRMTITTADGKTYVLRLGAPLTHNAAQDARSASQLLLCDGALATESDSEPACLALELITPPKPLAQPRTL